jgi:4-diphosphocytidyl-2-C-methyl-D-erythritol kinase
MPGAERLAPAKINLTLHVGALAPDGYHPLSSLVTFADVGDRVRLEPAAEMSFAVEGPFADHLSAGPDNLVVRARERFEAAFEPGWSPFRLVLEKNLPIAAGLGGGSADAAAALRLMAARLGIERSEEAQLAELAGDLGSDVPMCLAGFPAIAEGRGDVLEWPPRFPDLPAVLVNPLKPSPTGQVYRAYDDAGAPGGADRPEWPEAFETPTEVAAFLAGCRNDLQAPAVALQPAIGEVLAALSARPETLLARMSGSGATCFALCADNRARNDLALAMGDAHRDWWVQRCRLAGVWP